MHYPANDSIPVPANCLHLAYNIGCLHTIMGHLRVSLRIETVILEHCRRLGRYKVYSLPSSSRPALVDRLICSSFVSFVLRSSAGRLYAIVNLVRPWPLPTSTFLSLVASPATDRIPALGARGATLRVYTYVFFRAGEHIQTQRQDGSSKECALSRGQSSSSEDAQTIAVGYVSLGCMIAAL